MALKVRNVGEPTLRSGTAGAAHQVLFLVVRLAAGTEVREQLRRSQVEPVGDLNEHVEGRVADAALDARHIRPVEPEVEGKRLLR